MFQELLKRLGHSLSRHGIPYMIIGGQAVLLYGEPRVTRDIDITLGIGINEMEKILNVVKELDLKPLPENLNKFVKDTMVLPCLEERTKIRVDFIFSHTDYEERAISRANRIDIDGQSVYFASVEDLIIHKIFAGRPRDIEDVKSIMIKNPEIDIDYIKAWLKEFDKTLNESFSGLFEKLVKDLSSYP